MGYPKPLKAISRKLTDNVVITSTAFSCFDRFNFGARMALIKVNKDIIVWSAIPYGAEVEEALELFNDSSLNISHLVVPDVQHTLGVASFKEKFPHIKIIGPEAATNVEFDYKFTEKDGNRVLSKEGLKNEIGIKESTIFDNLEFVYLPKHTSKELILFDPKSKIIFESDLLFNLGCGEPLEQYSEATGYSDTFWSHSSWSFVTRYLQPSSVVGKFIFNKLAGAKDTEGQLGLQSIYSWDFETIVMCHGNIITKDAKETFKNVFSSAIPSKY